MSRSVQVGGDHLPFSLEERISVYGGNTEEQVIAEMKEQSTALNHSHVDPVDSGVNDSSMCLHDDATSCFESLRIKDGRDEQTMNNQPSCL